jgi:hypothetical protein
MWRVSKEKGELILRGECQARRKEKSGIPIGKKPRILLALSIK